MKQPRQMVLVFTGTQDGWTEKQGKGVSKFLDEHKPVLVVHGDCIGSDTLFHKMCQKKGINIIGFPCDIIEKRAFNKGFKVLHEPKRPLVRNVNMVMEGTYLLATPKTKKEILRSGTWHTVRQARKYGVSYTILEP